MQHLNFCVFFVMKEKNILYRLLDSLIDFTQILTSALKGFNYKRMFLKEYCPKGQLSLPIKGAWNVTTKKQASHSARIGYMVDKTDSRSEDRNVLLPCDFVGEEVGVIQCSLCSPAEINALGIIEWL